MVMHMRSLVIFLSGTLLVQISYANATENRIKLDVQADAVRHFGSLDVLTTS